MFNSQMPRDSRSPSERFSQNLTLEVFNLIKTDFSEGITTLEDVEEFLMGISLLTGVPLDLMVAGHALAFNLAEVGYGGEWTKPVTQQSAPDDPKLAGDAFAVNFYEDDTAPIQLGVFRALERQ